MANAYMDSSLLDRAIIFAVKAHANTERRGKGFPYIVHPMEAMAIVSTMTSDQELLAAAALHDVVEDTETGIEDIRKEFGDRIASLVAAESDVVVEGQSEEESWHKRKQAAIDRLAAASHDAKIVAMGDKLSNMRAIARDWHDLGDKLWNIFHCKEKSEHEWHYRGLGESLKDLEQTHAYREYQQLLKMVFGPEKPVLIDLNNYKASGEGYTAQSYDSKDGKMMIKLYSERVDKSVTENELKIARSVYRMGISTPRPGRYVTDGKRVGAEFERISPKKSFARAISNEPDRLEEYAARFAAMVRKLHSTPCDTSELPNIKKSFHAYVARVSEFDDEQKKKIDAFIDSVEDRRTCLHGDMHIGNIITNDVQDWWIDLGDFSWGNPMFDLGMFYFVCNCNPDELTMELYHINNAQIRRVWEIFCKEYFGPDYEGRQEDIDRMVAPFAALKMFDFIGRVGMQPGMKEFIEQTLL